VDNIAESQKIFYAGRKPEKWKEETGGNKEKKGKKEK
jgi:hypothetical protein